MIQILKNEDDKWVPTYRIEGRCWVNIAAPEAEEIEKLARELEIPMDFFTDSLDVDERARIEAEDHATLVLIRVPKFDPNKTDIPFTTLPVGIILTGDILITICAEDVNSFLVIQNRRVRNLSAQSRKRFILQFFLVVALLYLKYLKEINQKTTEVELQLQKALKNEALIKLLNLEKSLVFFTTSLKSNELMMERLQKSPLFKMDEEDQDLLEDVLIDNKQAIEMASIYSNILSGMMDAFASVISNNLNVVMKLLTSVTIILMLPNLVASIYGMNIELPFQQDPHAFLIIICITVMVSIAAIGLFIKKRLF